MPLRLLSTETGQFVEINDPAKFEYAILSHTWDPAGEQSYREVRQIQKAFDLPILPESAIPEAFHIPLAMQSPSSPAASSDLGPYDLELRHSPVHPPSVLYDTSSLCSSPREYQPTPAPLAASTVLDHPSISPKIKEACALARRYGHRFIWIDSCCIDKESSSELSEAINSMFRWYRDASVCYAYLADVPVSDLETSEERTEMRFLISVRERFSLFQQSRWFTRGWTLQELVAPRVVIFVSQEWLFYGSKGALADVISEVTRIDCEVLSGRKQLRDISVFQRMSWASRRTTTRLEDQAYSLLGIFDMHMPILYGEGHRAFMRLQQAILKEIPDESLFIWNTSGSPAGGVDTVLRLPSSRFQNFGPVTVPRVPLHSNTTTFQREHSQPTEPGLLANRPSDFALSPHQRVSAVSHLQFAHRLGMQDVSLPKYTMTPYGINACFPFIPVNQVFPPNSITGSLEAYHLALLACEDSNEPGSLIAMVCSLERFQANRRLMKRVSFFALPVEHVRTTVFTYVVLSRAQIERLDRANFRITKVHIPTCAVPNLSSTISHMPQEMDNLLPPLSPWNLEILRESGFAVTCLCDGPSGNLRLVRLVREEGGIQLRFEVIAAFICIVNVWITAFHRCPSCAETTELCQDASPIPTFHFQIRDVHQEQSAQFNLPSTSGGQSITIRLALYYFTSSNSCSLSLEALRSVPEPVLGDTSPSIMRTSDTPSSPRSLEIGTSHRADAGEHTNWQGTKSVEDEDTEDESGRSRKRRRVSQ